MTPEQARVEAALASGNHDPELVAAIRALLDGPSAESMVKTWFLVDATGTGSKIRLIKYVRQVTGEDLKDAFRRVESMLIGPTELVATGPKYQADMFVKQCATIQVAACVIAQGPGG